MQLEITMHEKGGWFIWISTTQGIDWEKTILVTLLLCSTPWTTPKMKDILAAYSKFRHPKCSYNIFPQSGFAMLRKKAKGTCLNHLIHQPDVSGISLLTSHQVCFLRIYCVGVLFYWYMDINIYIYIYYHILYLYGTSTLDNNLFWILLVGSKISRKLPLQKFSDAFLTNLSVIKCSASSAAASKVAFKNTAVILKRRCG
jgi:hypothetical protein